MNTTKWKMHRSASLWKIGENSRKTNQNSNLLSRDGCWHEWMNSLQFFSSCYWFVNTISCLGTTASSSIPMHGLFIQVSEWYFHLVWMFFVWACLLSKVMNIFIHDKFHMFTCVSHIRIRWMTLSSTPTITFIVQGLVWSSAVYTREYTIMFHAF